MWTGINWWFNTILGFPELLPFKQCVSEVWPEGTGTWSCEKITTGHHVTRRTASAFLLTGSHPQKGRGSGGGAVWDATQQPGEPCRGSNLCGPPRSAEERGLLIVSRKGEKHEIHLHGFSVIRTQRARLFRSSLLFCKSFITFSTESFALREEVLHLKRIFLGMCFLIEEESYWCFILFLSGFQANLGGKGGFNFFS